ncbi:DUF3862 domain-containing protein [Bombilactobacillus mellifer]|uniref:DUF3862 domain-containing protein n=1 Tax=Bombilactobacillus mellifer TaxID=1218492 RepID=UPI003C6CA287
MKEKFGQPPSTSSQTIQDVKTEKTLGKIQNCDLGSTFAVGFSNGKAISKTITGLKVSRNKKLILQDFNQIQDGQSREDVFNTLDTPNEYSESKSVIRIVK